MPTLEPQQLSGSLKMGLQPLYCIHGEEELLRLEALEQIRAVAKQRGYIKTSYTVEGAHFDWHELVAQTASTGLFGEASLCEIHVPSGKVGKQGSEILLKWAQQPPVDTTVVLILPKLDKAQMQSKWFTAWAKQASVLPCKAIQAAALPAWIRNRLQQNQLDIQSEALTLFAERVEGNLLAAKQEIDKLALLYPAGHLLTLADAQQAVANVARFDVFQLSSAWMAGDVGRVMRLLDGLEAEGDEPVLLVWALAEDIRILIRLMAALKQGQTVAMVRNELRLWGDKQTLAPKAVARMSPMRLINALQECAKIDRQIKGVEEGNAWASFKQLTISLAM